MQAPERRDILSGEELRELLWSDPSKPESSIRPAAKAEVLFVARRGHDSELLEGRLTAVGAQVVAVRNPFAALDRLRTAPPVAIVSDLELWAGECALLFERLRDAHLNLPVLLVSPASTDPEQIAERLTRAGAWGVLFRPVTPGDAETAARSVMAAARGTGPSPAQTGFLLTADAAPIVSGATLSPNATASVSSSSSDPEELACLRFHLELSRVRQLGSSLEARAALVIEAARAHLAPRSIAISFREHGRVSLKVDASSEKELHLVTELASESRRDETPSADCEGSLVLGTSPVPRLVLVGLAPELSAAARSIQKDLGALVDRALDE